MLIESEQSDGAYQNGLRRAAIGRDYGISDVRQLPHLTLCLASSHLRRGFELLRFSTAFRVAVRQDLVRGVEMYVMHCRSVSITHGPDLTRYPCRVDHKESTSGRAPNIVFNKPDQGVFDPRPAVPLVQPFARPLQGRPFLFEVRHLFANQVPRFDDPRAVFRNELFRERRLSGADRAGQDDDPQRIIVKIQMKALSLSPDALAANRRW